MLIVFFFRQGAMWPGNEVPREMYRKPARPGSVNARYQPYTMPRYHFTVRDLDRCLYGKQDLQVVHIEQKNPDINPEDKPAKCK